MRVNRPGALSILVCHRCQLVFVTQAQVPHWIMSLEMEMFLKKLSGLATEGSTDQVCCPCLCAIVANLYSTSASSLLDNVFGNGNVFEEALWAGHYEGQPTRCVVLTCAPSPPTSLHSTSASSPLANVFGNVNVSEEVQVICSN